MDFVGETPWNTPKPNEAKCSDTCVHNEQYRSYIKTAELAIMNVEYEIKRVAERHINIINDYPKEAKKLVPCDIINGMTANHEIINCLLFLGKIYRELPGNEDHRNITIILDSDGAPAVSTSSKYH